MSGRRDGLAPGVTTISAAPVRANDARRISLLLGVLFGLASMGSSSAAIALPLMAPDLGIGTGVAAWTVSLYALMLAVTTALYGRISDLVGIRLPLLVGVALMTTGAVLAASAPNLGLILAARMLQGAGAAAVPTLGVAALTARYDGDVRGRALSRLAGMSAAIACLGPLLGGSVEAVFGWRVVLALPALGLVVLPFVWHALLGEGSGARLDVVGAVLVAATSSGLVLLAQSPTSGLVVAGSGLVLLVAGAPLVVARVRRRPHGFLPLEVVRNGAVMRSAAAAAAIPAAWFALLVAVPAVLVADGWEPWQVGLLLVPSAVVALVMPRFTGPLLNRLGPPLTMAIAAVVASVALAIAALATYYLAAWPVTLAVMLTTLAFNLGQPAMSEAVGDAVHDDVRGVALGVATLLFLVGGSIGSAVVAGVGDLVGIPGALAVLVVLPLAGLAVLAPLVRGSRRQRVAARV